jgi:hypothetical protein
MTVNIEKAEEIVNCVTNNKKTALIQKQALYDIIQQVELKREYIENFILTVNIITQLHEQKKKSLEHVIHHIVNREQHIDQDLCKLSYQQKELEKRQSQLKLELETTRLYAEKCREKKIKCEQHYNSLASFPFLSLQSKKKYLQARDKNLEAEQQVSEMRCALDKCQEHLRLLSKTLSAQHAEQSILSDQRRGSIDTIKSASHQIDFLQKGRTFWKAFDTYQAQVVLESATYLYKELSKNHHFILQHNKEPSKTTLDVHQVWIKTFLLACFEYGERETYGDSRWSTLKIDFDCSLCQIPQFDWPKLIDHDLVCEFCYTIQSKAKATKPHQPQSKMKKIMSLFNTHSSKINPMIM